MAKQTIIAGTKAYHIFYNEVSQVWDIWVQPINAKTGKPWQASKRIKSFPANEKNKAYRFWLYEAKR